MQFIYSWNAFQSLVFNFLSHEWVCSSTYLGSSIIYGQYIIWSILLSKRHICVYKIWNLRSIWSMERLLKLFSTVPSLNSDVRPPITKPSLKFKFCPWLWGIYIIYFKLFLSFSKKWIESWKIFFSMMNQMRCMCWFLPIFCFIIKTQIWPAV